MSNGLTDNEAFYTGITTGIALYQQKVVTAYERKEPIKIADNLFYIQSSRERLAEMVNKILE